MRKMRAPRPRRSLSSRLDLYLKVRGKTRYSVLRSFALEYNQHPEKFSEQDRKNLAALWRKNGMQVQKNETPEDSWMMLEAQHNSPGSYVEGLLAVKTSTAVSGQVHGRSGAVKPPPLSAESPQMLGRTTKLK